MAAILVLWQRKIVYENSGSVTLYLDSSCTVAEYDFYNVTMRAGTVNRFFNTEIGEIDARVFDFRGRRRILSTLFRINYFHTLCGGIFPC